MLKVPLSFSKSRLPIRTPLGTVQAPAEQPPRCVAPGSSAVQSLSPLCLPAGTIHQRYLRPDVRPGVLGNGPRVTLSGSGSSRRRDAWRPAATPGPRKTCPGPSSGSEHFRTACHELILLAPLWSCPAQAQDCEAVGHLMVPPNQTDDRKVDNALMAGG